MGRWEIENSSSTVDEQPPAGAGATSASEPTTAIQPHQTTLVVRVLLPCQLTNNNHLNQWIVIQYQSQPRSSRHYNN